MRSYFVNLNPRVAPLPATLTVPAHGDLFYGRVIHTDRDHFNTPVARRPPLLLHEHYHIVIVQRGRCTFNIDGEELAAEMGDVFLTSPTQRHHFANVGRGNARYAEITFEFLNGEGRPLMLTFDRLLAAWTNQPCGPLLRTKATVTYRKAFDAAIRPLVARRSKRPTTDLELSAVLWAILAMTQEQLFQQPDTTRPERLDSIRDHLRATYRDEHSLEALAARAGVTANYLSRRFKQLYGRTPIDYQLDLRLRDACALLRTGDQLLEYVAKAVGFKDVYYFSRLFKKRIGTSPGKYRVSASDS